MSDVALLEPLGLAPHPPLDAPAPAPAAPPPVARPVEVTPMPSGRDLLAGIGGFLVAGACAGIGATAPDVALRALPSGLAVGMGALVLTGPALVVGHQYLGLAARPADLAAALADGFVRAGRTAAGFAPALAFFSLSTGLWVVAAGLVAATAGSVGFAWSGAALRRSEAPSMRMDGLVVAWSVLAGLVALRLAVDVALRVLG